MDWINFDDTEPVVGQEIVVRVENFVGEKRYAIGSWNSKGNFTIPDVLCPKCGTEAFFSVAWFLTPNSQTKRAGQWMPLSCFIRGNKAKRNTNNQKKEKSKVENTRYLLWMLCEGILEPAKSNHEYFVWLSKARQRFEKQKEIGVKDMDQYLIQYVRDCLIAKKGEK